MNKNFNEDNVRELQLYLENNGDLYRSNIRSYIDSLIKKYKKDNYDKEKATKGWYNIVMIAVKMYEKDFLKVGEGLKVFSVADRKEVANCIESTYFEEYVKEV